MNISTRLAAAETRHRAPVALPHCSAVLAAYIGAALLLQLDADTYLLSQRPGHASCLRCSDSMAQADSRPVADSTRHRFGIDMLPGYLFFVLLAAFSGVL